MAERAREQVVLNTRVRHTYLENSCEYIIDQGEIDAEGLGDVQNTHPQQSIEDCPLCVNNGLFLWFGMDPLCLGSHDLGKAYTIMKALGAPLQGQFKHTQYLNEKNEGQHMEISSKSEAYTHRPGSWPVWRSGRKSFNSEE